MSEKEPEAEGLIEHAGREGWGFFDHPVETPPSAAAQKAASERGQRVAAIAGVLWASVPEFRELVEFLLDQSLRRPTFVAQLGLPMDQAYGYGVFREGQNALAMMLLKLIAEGRKIEAPKGREP